MIGRTAERVRGDLVSEVCALRREVARLTAANERLTARIADLQKQLYEQSKGQKVMK